MNKAFHRLTLVSARTWNRVALYALAANFGNVALEITLGHAYSGASGLPVSLLAGGTGLVATGARISRKRVELQAALAADAEREAKAELERKWRADVYRVAFPDPRDGQCPVCGLDDLAALKETDEFAGDTGTGMARVVQYGPVDAHRECVQIVPYGKYYENSHECKHRFGYHHADIDPRCVACDRERDTGVKDPYPAPAGCACRKCAPPKPAKPEPGNLAPNEPWREYADIEPEWQRGDGLRYTWRCRYCTTSAKASTYEHAKATLIHHASSACPYRISLNPVLRAVASAYGVPPMMMGKIRPGESTAVPGIPWLDNALRSSDSQVRSAAEAILDRMRRLMP